MLSLSADKQSSNYRPTLARSVFRFFRWRLPTRVKIHRILSGSLRGKRIVTSWRDYPAAIAGITEPQLLKWFSENVGKGETWLDIGAHYGYTAIALCELVTVRGRVFAFEPTSSTVGCLAQTRSCNGYSQLSVVPIALGDVSELELARLGTVRGMVDSTRQSTESTAGIVSESFLVSQLDWLWPRISGDNRLIHGLKIDVQGMEVHVLRGMAATLKAYRPKLVLELHKGINREEILSLLEAAGYSTSATPLEPVEGERLPMFVDDRSYAFLPR